MEELKKKIEELNQLRKQKLEEEEKRKQEEEIKAEEKLKLEEEEKIQEIEEDNWIENIPKDDSKTLYYINYAEMMNINLDFSLIEKI